jgi:hypothetical protein
MYYVKVKLLNGEGNPKEPIFFLGVSLSLF